MADQSEFVLQLLRAGRSAFPGLLAVERALAILRQSGWLVNWFRRAGYPGFTRAWHLESACRMRTAHSLARVDFSAPLRVFDCNEASRFLTEQLEENHKYGANLKL